LQFLEKMEGDELKKMKDEEIKRNPSAQLLPLEEGFFQKIVYGVINEMFKGRLELEKEAIMDKIIAMQSALDKMLLEKDPEYVSLIKLRNSKVRNEILKEDPEYIALKQELAEKNAALESLDLRNIIATFSAYSIFSKIAAQQEGVATTLHSADAAAEDVRFAATLLSHDSLKDEVAMCKKIKDLVAEQVSEAMHSKIERPSRGLSPSSALTLEGSGLGSRG